MTAELLGQFWARQNQLLKTKRIITIVMLVAIMCLTAVFISRVFIVGGWLVMGLFIRLQLCRSWSHAVSAVLAKCCADFAVLGLRSDGKRKPETGSVARKNRVGAL
jgi:hypothetical protein